MPMRRPICLLILFVAAMSIAAKAPAGPNAATTRPAACAGSWYPAEPAALRKLLKGYLDKATVRDLPGRPVAVIAPHAGYAYSGPTAALAFKAVSGMGFSRIILIGPSHHMAGAYAGGAIPKVTHFATPLGNVPLDRALCEKFCTSDVFAADDRPHAREHCLEMELPLLQCVLKDFTIVPILMGKADAKMFVKMASVIRPAVDKKTLIVVSTDFVHHGPNYGYQPFKTDVAKNIARLDTAAIDRILAVDRLGFVDVVQATGATICGRWAVATALEVFAGRSDVEGVRLGYTTSGAITKNWDNSVSYAAIALCAGAASPLTADERKCLLRIARGQVREFLKAGKELTGVEKRYSLTPRLKKPGPAFVTLTRGGDLRGCIGHVVPVEPLYKSVLHNAIKACRDHRFASDRVTAAEEPKLHIEISVLSRYRKIARTDEIKIGRDGLIIRCGRNSGLLLPQVPVQKKWDLKAYLRGICRKAGLPAQAINDPNTRLYRFTAQVFGEAHAATASAPATKPAR